VKPRGFSDGAADRRMEARHPGGLLRAAAALEYEVRCLPEWDVLLPEPAGDPGDDAASDAAPTSD